MIILERLVQLGGVWRKFTGPRFDIEYTKMLWDQVAEKHLKIFFWEEQKFRYSMENIIE